MKLAKHPLSPGLQNVLHIPSEQRRRTLGRCIVQVFRVSRQLQENVGKFAGNVFHDGSVGKGGAVGRQARALIKVLDLFPVARGQRAEIMAIPELDAGIEDDVGCALSEKLKSAGALLLHQCPDHVREGEFQLASDAQGFGELDVPTHHLWLLHNFEIRHFWNLIMNF